jgi:excisionase family DNA binding protein
MPARRASIGNEGWVPITRAARYAGVCSETLRRAVRSGALPHGRAGRLRIRLKLNDVDAWLRGGAEVAR